VWIKLAITLEETLCHCRSSSNVLEDWSASSYGEALQQNAHLDFLTLKTKVVQSFGSYLPGNKVSHTRRLEYSVKCDVQLFSIFSADSCVMDVLEIAYNCFLMNYKAWKLVFVSSGMLKLFQVQEWPPVHSEAAH
jgi:hypothetical protein